MKLEWFLKIGINRKYTACIVNQKLPFYAFQKELDNIRIKLWKQGVSSMQYRYKYETMKQQEK